jgi:hypothetical protein
MRVVPVKSAARTSSAPSPNRATAPSGGGASWAEQSRQAIAEARQRWYAERASGKVPCAIGWPLVARANPRDESPFVKV